MKITNHILSHLKQALPALFLLAAAGLTGCSDDLDDGSRNGRPGEKVYGTLSVPLGSSAADVRTRSVDFDDNAEIKIDSYWIGIYDSQTGERVGTRLDEAPRKSDGTRYTVKSNTPFVAEEIPVYYYDSNPEVYIVGVINFTDITARKIGDEEEQDYTLRQLLEEAGNFSDLHAISVTTESADNKQFQESSGVNMRPLMIGYYTPTRTTLHTTVNRDGSLNQDDVRIRLASNGDNHSAMSLPGGAVRLQRLLSEIQVNISAGEQVKLSNVRYRVVNNPTEVFLEEHTTLMTGGTLTSREDFLAETPNSADFRENGYTADDQFADASYDSGNDSYTFTYQGYENKHWGRSYNGNTNRPHAYREEMYTRPENTDEAVFRALCPDQQHPYNNGASYFIIQADIDVRPGEEGGEALSGTVSYLIHEGYACRPDGSASRNLYDFQRIRNTRYTYQVTINGLDDLTLNVNSSSMHDDGISGSFHTNGIQQLAASYPEKPAFSLTYAECLQFRWCYRETKLDGSLIQYGEWDSDATYYPDWADWAGTGLNTDPSVYAALDDIIRFSTIDYDSNPMTLTQFLQYIKTNPGNYTFYIYFDNYAAEDNSRPEANRRGFYLLREGKSDYDGCTRQESQLIGFEQQAADLRRTVNLSMSPSYESWFDIGYDHSYGYSKYYDDYVYNYTPYFQKDYYESYGYTKNERFWSGSRSTGAYLKFFDYNGYRDGIRIEIYDPTDSYVELTLHATYDEHCIYGGHDAIYLVPITGSDLSRLSVGYHSVVFTADGDPSAYIPGESSRLPHALHIIDTPSWNLIAPMDNTTETMASYFRDGLINNGAYRVLDYGGLLIAGGRNFSGSNSYIQTGRAGFPYSTVEANKGGYFKLTLNKRGQIRVYARHTGGTASERNLYLYKPRYSYGGEDKYSYYTQVYQSPQEYIQLDKQPVDGSYSDFDTATTLDTGEVDDITDFFICSDQNILIQRIEFVPVY